MEIITGYTGKAHIFSEQDRDVNIGIVGEGSYVLQTGMQLEAEVSSNNEIKIRDGVLMHQGCTASIKKNTYYSLTIINGSQGMKRIDLIVARYERNQDNGAESIGLKVIQGTPAESNPAVPSHITGDIQSGDAVADMPMYKIIIDGLNITEVQKVYSEAPNITELNRKLILYEWETTVKPFASINPGNKLTFTVRKIGRVCTGNILWVGSVSGTNATLTDFTIPEPFRPIKTEYYSASLISSGKVFGSSRLDISNLGKVTYATDQEGFVERYVSFSYIGNDITPDEMYLVDNL